MRGLLSILAKELYILHYFWMLKENFVAIPVIFSSFLNYNFWNNFQQLKLATGDENIKRRIARSARAQDEEKFLETTTFDSLEIADDATTDAIYIEDDADDDNDDEDMLITTEWSPAR